MSEEQELEQQFVEVIWDDGTIVKCEIYDVIDFENKVYALLLPLETDENDEDAELVLMEYVEEGEDDGYFQNIEDEAEFNRVCEYIQTLDDENDEEDE